MGIFDRILRVKLGGSSERHSMAIAPEQEAQRLIEDGNSIEDQGNLRGALACYENAVRAAPNFPPAHLNCGNALLALGEMENAAHAYRNALTQNPDYSAAHYNLANALASCNRHDEAIAHYGRARLLSPNFVDVELALGSLYETMSKPDDATASYKRALLINPDSAPAHACLGNVHRSGAEFDQAINAYRRALEIDPQLLIAQFGLAEALQALSRHEEAVHCYRRVLQIKPDFALAHGKLGLSLQAVGQTDAAASSYRNALAISPDLLAAHYGLGVALNDLGQSKLAANSFQHALRLNPNHTNSLCMLGNLLLDCGQLHDAATHYRQVLEIEPSNVVAHNNLGNVFRLLGQMNDAVASYQSALTIDPENTGTHSNVLFAHNSLADQLPDQLLESARQFGKLVARRARPFVDWPNLLAPDRLLRIGFVSGDLCAHPVGYFVVDVLSALAAQAAGSLELCAYSNHSIFDDVSATIKSSCRVWREVSHLTDEQLAQNIRADGIDILIDLSGHTGRNRLPMFAWKPAPVQVTWLGYLATTGVEAIDYIIGDAWTIPEAGENHFSEKVWCLPQTYLCFRPPLFSEATDSLPALANGYITFGSFNNLAKLNDRVVAVWSRLLLSVPNSRLLLKAEPLKDQAVRARLSERFSQHGVDKERLILVGHVPRADYLKAFQRLDIGLDPFPYPGITTTVETLSMGVPVLTLAGQSFMSRQGVGLLKNAGLPDWIASSEADYVARGMSHARDLQLLTATRAELRKRLPSSPIFNATGFANHFDEALRTMWRKWCSQQSSGC